MKTSLAVSGCLVLLFFSWVSPGEAQQPQTPPPQTTPPQTTPATPPAAPEQTPLAQPQTGIRQPPPPLPKIPDIRQPGETGFWVGLTGWFPVEKPVIDKGHGAAFTQASKTQLQGKPKYAQGAEAGFAVGLHNALRFSYFQSRAAGNLINPGDTVLWGKFYPVGENVSTNYRFQNAKISFEYLTWPYPVESRRFRLKTLWQLQYTAIRTVFDRPTQPLVDSNGLPLADASGNPLSYAGEGTRSFLSPTFGLGVAEWVSRNFRLEANASGFSIPHRNTIWDTDASANLRFGHFELKVGAKAFHFSTSPKAEFFVKNTMASAMVGLRWYSN